MKTRNGWRVCVLAVCVLAMGNVAWAGLICGVDINVVTVGYAGDTGTATDEYGWPLAKAYGCAAADDEFHLGHNEITNAQRTVFVSLAEVPTGRDGGYHDSASWTGFQQAGHNVSRYGAAQFRNYLTSNDKLRGAYLFEDGWFTDIDRTAAQAAHGTIYVIPTDNQWYKTVYRYNDGVTGFFTGVIRRDQAVWPAPI